MLIVNEHTERFNMEEIRRGTLICAKHRTWKEPEKGFVVSANEREVIVQYPPVIGNVTNQFFISAKEAAAGEWEIRYSNDMQTVIVYPEGKANESETVNL